MDKEEEHQNVYHNLTLTVCDRDSVPVPLQMKAFSLVNNMFKLKFINVNYPNIVTNLKLHTTIDCLHIYLIIVIWMKMEGML